MSLRTKPCQMTDECWERIPITHTFCTACASWWHRIQSLDDASLARYIKRTRRYAGRLTVAEKRAKGRTLVFNRNRRAA